MHIETILRAVKHVRNQQTCICRLNLLYDTQGEPLEDKETN